MADEDPTDKPSADTHIFGPTTHHRSVRSDPDDARAWLQAGPVCQILRQHHIAHTGIMEAAPPYEVVRVDQSGTFMLACYEGEGVVLVDGAWKRITAGQACLLPPFVKNALKCLPEQEWRFAWVRYKESRDSIPIVSTLSPVSGEFDSLPLKAAIEGLYQEASGSAGASLLHHWVELVHGYVLKFAQPRQSDERLWRLWTHVEAHLKHDWSLTDLAGIACVSEEHLRRLCLKELGRSPIQHLKFLRLQRARHLLAVTDDKVEVIAHAVGFKNAFNFSNIFKAWIGTRPSDYRQGK